MTEQIRQKEPVAMPTRLDATGEIRARWAWVEAEVWTEPMLTALENGARGGQWFSLWDNPYSLARLDSLIRVRLRSILRRRRGGKGIGRGRDRIRWPNAYFAAHGLFSLVTAYAAARQSSSR